MGASVPVDPSRPSEAQAILERVVGGSLPPVPRARDQFITRRTVEDADAFAAIAKQAGFHEVSVVRFDESTTWRNPQHYIDMASGWWSMAIRLDSVPANVRDAPSHAASTRSRRSSAPGHSRSLVRRTSCSRLAERHGSDRKD